MTGLSRVVALALLLACDAAPEGDTDATGGDGDGSTGDAAPADPGPPDPCGTVGDWCDVALGDAQCGERMACAALPDDGVAWGVCVAPCSEASECAVGKCRYEVGACYGDASELVAVLACE